MKVSEIDNQIKEEELLLRAFEEEFKELAPTCRDRIIASNGGAICTYHGSSPTDCRFPICPKLDLSLDVAANYLEKTEGRRR